MSGKGEGENEGENVWDVQHGTSTGLCEKGIGARAAAMDESGTSTKNMRFSCR